MKNKERSIWLIITIVLAAALTFSLLSPGSTLQVSSRKNNDYLIMLGQLFDYIEENFVEDVSAETLYEGAAKGMFDSLDDPYSVYLTADDMEDFTDTTTGSFGGVGMFISKQSGKRPELTADSTFRDIYFDFVEVISPIEGTPAYRAGISAGDFIIEIDGESAEGLSSDEVADRLRGEPGTEVSFKIRRQGNIEREVTVKREVIEVPTVKYAMIDDETAYLKIVRWTPYTEESVKEAVNFFEKAGYSYLVVDVRGNPGGLLSSVVDTADLFLDDGMIVSTKNRDQVNIEEFKATRRTDVDNSIPVILLIDKGSASASEILAGALKDNDRAYLIGETSFGKGSVQQIRGFGDGGFKLTTSRYYTPSGINIDHIGIEPQKEITEEELSDDEVLSLEKLIENNYIPVFVEEHPDADEKRISEFITGLKTEGIALEDRLLRRLIRAEFNRTENDPPIFDLDYDIVLQYAVDLFESGGYKDLDIFR